MARSAKELKTLRLSLGWTCAEMTRRLGCRKELLLGYESGAVTPDPDTYHQYEGLFSILEEQTRGHRIRPIADHLLQVENLQQVDCDEVDQEPIAQKHLGL